MTRSYLLNSGLKFGSVPFGAVVATSTVNRWVSSRYFFIIFVVSGQFLWLFWPSTMSVLIGGAVLGLRDAAEHRPSRMAKTTKRVMGGSEGRFKWAIA